MRVLAIRGENLASLDGAFEVDLASGPLGRVGLFAITGSTGSGKSTLLDALCLALYDTTPRLDGRGGERVGAAHVSEDQRLPALDVRGLLRRGRGHGFAEVDFVGVDGKRYRARWSVRRAHRRADGALQSQELSLIDLDDDPDRPLTRTKTETLAAIEERVGLTFQQFRRSALLAQGDFAAFLHASSDERATLLERMTGTEIYGRLSEEAHARAREERFRLRDVERRIDARDVLGAEGRGALEARVDAARAEQRAATVRCETVQARLRADDAYRRAERDLVAARNGVAEAEQAQIAARTARVAAHVAHLRALAERAAASAVRVEAAVGAADAARSEIATVELWRSEHPEDLKLEAVWPACEEPLRVVADTEGRLPKLRDEVTAASDALAPLETGVRDAETARLAAQSRCETAEKAIDRAAAGEGEPGGLTAATLDEKLATAEARLEWLGARATVAGLQAEREKTAEDRARLGGERDAARAALGEADTALAAAERSRRGVEAALDVAGHRADLVDGEPCPLCGATEHPWSEGAPRVEALDAVRAAESGARSHRDEKAAAVAALEARIARLGERGQEIAAELTDAARDVAAALVAWRATRPDEDGDEAQPDEVTRKAARAEIDALRQRRRQVDAARKAFDEARRVEGSARDELDAAKGRLREGRETVEQAKRSVDSAEAERAKALEALATRVGPFAREVEEPAVEWQRRLGAVVAGVRQGATQHDALVKQLGSLDVACTEARGALERDEAALAAAASSYGRDAPDVEAPSGTDAELVEAVASAAENVVDAERAVREADAGAQTARALAKGAADGVVEAREAVPPAPDDERLAAVWSDPEALRELLSVLSKARETAQAALEKVAGELHADDEARAAVSALRAELETLRKAAGVWLRLAELIGSADGKKLRSFAQGMTLDVLLRESNHQLTDLAPRYVLQRVPDDDLSLQVVDRDLGDEIRSVRSLSGGESFLVSLALALGLASMASQRAPVESLFIDEGFGTLDPESLDIAISALDALQASGRQVGVISHVPGLAEQIGVQVRVEAQGGGRSTVRVTAPAVA